MIDIQHEQLRLLTEAPRDIPGRPHISTVIRWSSKGIRGGHLETVLIGGRRFTSVEAIARFIDRLSRPAGMALTVSDNAPARSAAWVRQELDAAGF